MRCEAGPCVHFEKQVGDLDVRQRCCDLIDQPLRCLRHGRVERRNLQAGVGQDRIGQIVRAGQRIDQMKLLVEGFKPILQIVLAVRFNGQPEVLCVPELREPLSRQRGIR